MQRLLFIPISQVHGSECLIASISIMPYLAVTQTYLTYRTVLLQGRPDRASTACGVCVGWVSVNAPPFPVVMGVDEIRLDGKTASSLWSRIAKFRSVGQSVLKWERGSRLWNIEILLTKLLVFEYTKRLLFF